MAKNEQWAFSLLYNRYWEELFITAVKVLRVKEEAEDIVQDVFISLWSRRNELSIESSLKAYLQTCIRYKAIHYIEKNITRRNYLALLTEVAGRYAPASQEMQLHLKEIQTTIDKAVSKMPPKMREVYRLSRQEQLTHREIAEKMDISVETVKKHIQFALQLIKRDLGYSSVFFLLLAASPYFRILE